MKYMIVYGKTDPLTAYRNTLEEAKCLEEKLKNSGYTVDIWEKDENGARKIKNEK